MVHERCSEHHVAGSGLSCVSTLAVAFSWLVGPWMLTFMGRDTVEIVSQGHKVWVFGVDVL